MRFAVGVLGQNALFWGLEMSFLGHTWPFLGHNGPFFVLKNCSNTSSYMLVTIVDQN